MRLSWHWFRLSRAAWRSITIVVVLLVLYVLAGRQLMPMLDRTAPNIAEYLSEHLEQPVEFQSIQGYWYGLRPTLVLEGVGIANDLSIGRVVIEPAILASMIQRRPQLSRLELDGIRIELAQIDGVWKIPALRAFANRPWYETLAILTGEGVGIDAINLRDFTVSLSGQSSRLDLYIRDGVWLSQPNQQQLRGFANIGDGQTWAQADVQLDILTDAHEHNIFLSLNHTQFDYLTIPEELIAHLPWRPESMMLAAQSRWHWQQGQLKAVELAVQDGDLAIALPDDSLAELSDVQFNFAWQRQDELSFQLRNLGFTQNSERWPTTDLDLLWSDERVLILANHIPLEPFQNIALMMTQSALIESLQPSGQVDELTLRIPRSGPKWLWEEMTGSGQLLDVSFNRFQWIPGLSGVNGRFQFSPQQGLVELEPSKLVIELPDLLPDPIEMALQKGLVGWLLSDDGRLHITSSELDFAWRDSGQVQGRFNFAGTLGATEDVLVEPVFALALRGNQLQAESLNSAIPIMVPLAIQRWLQQQIITLEADQWSVLLPNVLAKDLKPRLGLMQANVTQAQVEIGAPWPDYIVESALFSLDHHGLRLSIDDSSYGDLAIASAELQLPFNQRPEVQISGLAMGRTEDALRLVRDTPVRNRIHPELLTAEVVGSLAGTVDLRIPLQGDPFVIDLGLAIRNVDFYWPNYDVRIEDLSGPVSISLNNGVHSSGLSGRFLNGPIQLSLSSRPLTMGGWHIEMPVRGAVNSESLLTWLDFALFNDHEGQTLPYDGQLTFTPDRTRLAIDAEIGAFADQLSLPVSYDEPELALQLDFEPDTRSVLLRWPGIIVADVRTFTDWYPINGHVAMGQAPPQLRPERGVVVDIQFPELTISDWTEFNQRLSGSANMDQPQFWRAALLNLQDWQISHVRLQTDAITDWPMFADGLEMTLARQQAAWQSQFAAQSVLGSLWLPDAPQSQGRLSLQRVILGESSPQPDDIDPVLPQDRIYPVYDPDADALARLRAHWFPNLAVSVHDVVLNGQSLGPWSFNLVAASDVLQLQNIRGTWRTVDVMGQINWQTPPEGWPQTQAELTLRAANMADVLRASRLSPVVTSRRATGEVQLLWPGSPMASNRYRWQGDVRFDLYDGSVLELEDLEAVRLIGLLNVTRIFRRLALDFQDVFGAGISFDRVRGHLLFDDGLVSVGDRLTLQGSGARMFFEGDYQMLRDALDAEGVMVARVSNTAGLLAIGAGFAPPLALAIILGERALEREIERLFSVRTSITGSLTKPVVESRRLFDSDIRGADTTFEERLRELFGPDQRTDSTAP